MKTPSIVPCLWFDEQAESAAAFYTRTFPQGRIVARSHYPQNRDNPGGRPRGSVLTVEFEVCGQAFTALNGGPHFVVNPSISFFVHVEGPQEADRLFSTLVEGGQALMPLGRYPWSERYGWAKDRFGVSWQVISGRRPAGGATVVPCLMFSGAQRGRAEEAMRAYASIFPNGSIKSVARYEPNEGLSGAVKHGLFVLAGQEMIAMDSHSDQQVPFNEGISLQVMCKDQSEVDRYWEALAERGEKGPCGWLKDRFGLSWQVTPIEVSAWMTSKDAAAKDRAFAAMLEMQKLDVATLARAFKGA